MGKLSRLLFLVMLVFSLGLFGCADDGDDGRDGAAGASAYEIAGGDAVWGSEQAWLDSLQGEDAVSPVSTVPPLETCYMCHEGAIPSADPEVAHAVTGEVSYSVVTPPAAAGDDVVLVMNIKVDGVNDNSFTTVQRAVIFNGVSGVYTQYDFRPRLSNTLGAVIDGVPVNGNYTIRIKPSTTGATPPVALPLPSSFVGGDTKYYFRLGSTSGARASVSANDAGYVRPDLVSDQACINCHGDFTSGHHYNPFNVSNCVACHGAENAPFLDLPSLIHGIHNSHNMPSGHFASGGEEWSVTYPTYMTNCSVCHDTDAGKVAMVDAPVTYSLCMSCHENWSGFPFEGTAAPFEAYHQSLTAASDCSGCHPGAAPGTVAAFHNGLQTERSGVIWNGQDLSVVEGAKVDMQITGVTRTDNNLAVTWTAKYDGATVDPCNAVATVGNPAFHAAAANTATGQVASNLSLLRAYAQGDDFINPGIGTAPGQPVATNLSTTNTVCASNVATTTIALTAAEVATTAAKGIVALQGKAQVHLGLADYNPAVAGNQTVDQVRSKTPTREFLVATGALPSAANQRRAIADTDACLKCHVGSLYQHGGNRVDNVTMCIMCHNEASSEQNVRVFDGVDASVAYDGQAGQTYGFKSLLHAIHSTGSDVNPNKITMIYRTNGVYVWAPEGVEPPNWPTIDEWDGALVYGSSAPHGTGPNGEVYRVHHLYHPTYPRALNDCAACHVANFAMVPDQAKSMATTINVGTVAPTQASSTNAVYGIQTDDTLEGTGAAACVSCHQTVKSHVYQNGWVPAVFPNGRQTIIDTVQ